MALFVATQPAEEELIDAFYVQIRTRASERRLM